MRILIAEDDASNVLYLETLLEAYGEVKVAHSGPAALNLFEEAHAQGQPFAVIFMDVGIPEMDGLSITRKIRDWEAQHQGAQKTAIIMQTGKVLTDEVLASFKSGADLFVPKPFKPSIVRGFMKECGFGRG